MAEHGPAMFMAISCLGRIWQTALHFFAALAAAVSRAKAAFHLAASLG